MSDQSPKNALFSLAGPNEDGCVWISSTGEIDWQHNVGPADKVAEVLSRWLASFVAADTLAITQDE